MTETVLIGAAGTGTAFGAISAIRRVWGGAVQIVAMDLHPAHLVTASLLADVFETVPYATSAAFAERVLRIVEERRVTVYLPLVPAEIARASALKEQERSRLRNVRVMAPPSFASDACNDKLKLAELLTSHDIAVPATAPASEPFSSREFFGKPRSGFGSRSARKLTAKALAEMSQDEKRELVVQEICSPPEVTIDCFVDPAKGFCRALGRERLDVKAGVSTKCRIFENEQLSAIGLSISRVLALDGSFCFQTMYDAAGSFVVTDVNPRPGAGTAMCWSTGNDFHAANFARCWDEPYEHYFRPLQGSSFVTRQYVEFLTGASR